MKKQGLIKMIILIVIALIVLGYFGFDIKGIMSSSTVQGNLSYVWDFVKTFWNNYLAAPVVYVWDNLIIGVVWKVFQHGLNLIQQ